MITNKHEIAIERIKGIKTMHFVDVSEGVNKTNESDYLTLIVNYGNKESLKYNYKDEHFPVFLRKVVDTYSKMENKDDVLLIGSNTKRILGELENLYKEIDNNTKEIPFVQDYPIIENSTQRFDVRIIEGIIKDLSKSLIFLDTSTMGYNYEGITGYKNRYSLVYTRNNIKEFIPITISKQGQNYKFSTTSIGNSIFDINGHIDFYDDAIFASWIDENTMIRGNITYSINKEDEQNIVKTDNKIIGLDKKVDTLSENNIETINLYKNLYDLKISKVNKSNEDIYLGENTEVIDNTLNKENCYFYLTDDLANIKIKKKRNLKYDDKCSFYLENEDIDIILRKIEIDNKKYILEQINYLPTRSNGEYKYFYQNKYNYKLYEINDEGSLANGFEIRKEIKINSEITSIKDLKNIVNVKEGVKTYGTI